jgi:tRNA threonylcarbamoyl adenosine modification protein (Sua5/YciO/YrdC/YwlC family)
MSLFFRMHPENPQARMIRQSAQIVRDGGVIAYPTDSGYALGCHLGDKTALDRMRQIRQLGARHHFTLICRHLSEVGTFAAFDTPVYRLLKANTPGPYTFILRATRVVPRRVIHQKTKTIGIRIPDHPIVQALLTELEEPMLTTTLILPGDAHPMNNASEIHERLQNHVDLIIDGGPCGTIPTTVVDLSDDVPRILRVGRGDPSPFS